MSQSCATPKCDRLSRVPCDCCKQNLCILHFNEHNASLVSQLNPLTDEINVLGDRLDRLNIKQMLDDCYKKIEQWRLNCYQKIDYICEQKCQQLDLLIAGKIDKQRENTLHIQLKLAKLIGDQEVSRQDIDRLTSTIPHLETEMNKIEQARFSVNTRPLLVDDSLIQLKEIGVKELDLSTLSSVYRTIESPSRSSDAIASNGRLLLKHHAPNLCLIDTGLTIVKQVVWPHDLITDMCWSSTLDRFIVIAKGNIYLVDETTLFIERVQTVGKQNWFSCTCSNDQLFLSTNVYGTSILEMRLSPSIAVTKEWKPPVTCTMDEAINDMFYQNGVLATLISNEDKKSMRMELRCCKTLARLWSLPLDIEYDQNITYRCCSLDHNGWLVGDRNADRLLRITSDGKLKQIIPYKGKPYRVIRFDTNILAVSTGTVLNFHKI